MWFTLFPIEYHVKMWTAITLDLYVSFNEMEINVVVCGALCRQQRPRVHVPAEGPRGSEAGRESHAAVRPG